jgi:hypothetical protein
VVVVAVEPGERMRVKLVRRNEELGQSRTEQGIWAEDEGLWFNVIARVGIEILW